MSTEAIHTRGSYLARADGVRALGQHLARFAHYFMTVLDVAQQRRQLCSLDERFLKDIGISHTDAVREANRSFWDIPKNHQSSR